MKHRTGHLFKRGDNFYCRWAVDGKIFSKALRDDAGNAITSKRDAEGARDKLMASFAVATKAEALQSIATQLADTKTKLAEMEDQANPALLIANAWDAYMRSPARPDTGADTLAVYAGQFGQFAAWMAEKHPEATALRDVTETIAEEYAGHLNHDRLAPGTFNKHLNMLMLVFRVLYREAKLTVNPWLHPKKGGTIQRKVLAANVRKELTVEELRKVCQNAPAGEMRTLFALGIYSGLRLYDCATLLWGEVDLVRGQIVRVPHKISRKPNAQPVHIPIHPDLKAILSETPKESRGEYVFPRIAVEYAAGGTSKRKIINDIQDHFIAQGVKVHAPGTGPGTDKRAVVRIGFHSLRHSFVSIAREADVPLSIVESIVGHHSPAMTRHYTHSGEVALRKAIASLPSMLTDGTTKEPPKPTPEAILAQIRPLIAKLNSKNAKATREAMLALLDGKPAMLPAPATV